MPSGTVDATVVIGLAKGQVFDRLESLYSPLYVSSGVHQEVVAQGRGRPGVQELKQAAGSWITEVSVDHAATSPFAALTSTADREVLAVARAGAVDHVLSDDRVLRREASASGFVCLSTPEIVVLMKDQGLIPAVRPVLDLMRQRGFGIGEPDYQRALVAAGEEP